MKTRAPKLAMIDSEFTSTALSGSQALRSSRSSTT